MWVQKLFAYSKWLLFPGFLQKFIKINILDTWQEDDQNQDVVAKAASYDFYEKKEKKLWKFSGREAAR